MALTAVSSCASSTEPSVGAGPDAMTPSVSAADTDAGTMGQQPQPDDASDSGADLLVGEWIARGPAVNVRKLTLTVSADATLTFIADVAPFSSPPGLPPPLPGCVMLKTYHGTYIRTVSGGVHTLRWTFTEGTANQISGCEDASRNRPGEPLTAAAASAFIEQGHIPPPTLTYAVNPTTLVLSSGEARSGVGRAGTTFTRAP